MIVFLSSTPLEYFLNVFPVCYAPWRSHPANPGEGSDAPPTIERSGSERRVGAVNIPCPMRGKGLGESGGASLQGKGGRVGFRKVSLMVKRDGVILERLFIISCSLSSKRNATS